MRLFSYRNRPIHLGPFPLEKLTRADSPADMEAVPPASPLDFSSHPHESLMHAMSRYQGMMDLVRDGALNFGKAEITSDARHRSCHLKSAGYYFDASMVGICELLPSHFLEQPWRNPVIDSIREELEQGQPKTYSGGIDAIYADVLASARANLRPVPHHTHALIFLVEHTRDPRPDETGTDWIQDAQSGRAALLSSNTAVVLANYIRMLGFEARAHTQTASDIDLNRVAVASGLCAVVANGHADQLVNPFIGTGFGLAAVTTNLTLASDEPLGPNAGRSGWHTHGPAWWLGKDSERSAGSAIPYANRDFRMGPHPFEKIKRVDEPTTFIDEQRVPRFPKRADFFARSLFGDMGKHVQEAAKDGYYVMKAPLGACARRALGALLLLQFGDARCEVSPSVGDPQKNADNLKGASYFLSADAVGLSRVPDWAYYSHDAGGNPLTPYHTNAVSMLFDQGHETMEGASGDDWISASQSMRAYLRFSLLGGVIAEQIRRLGYSARVHSVLDSEVLQPPMVLLSGLGEVSRIGEVILNPFLGPRMKAGTVTTSLPMTHDKPIDFGLQHFCNNCNKCARECPSGAITAGPKLMYNGYEIWKSDAEKCTRYRLTNTAGNMCGRCMKTCPWNLEGLLSDSACRWMAINVPSSAKILARLDDALDRGTINQVKKWWWDLELDRSTNTYIKAASTNTRGLQKDLDLKYEDQTLAVYPADKMPPPYPITHAVDREEGIKRYESMLTPDEYKKRISEGKVEGLAPPASVPDGPPPVLSAVVSNRQDFEDEIMLFELERPNGEPFPAFDAGSHIDVIIAPEYQRQYSLAGNPKDRSKYEIGVLREENSRGGSELMHRVFRKGRTVMISPPRNHFPLDESAELSILLGGGIGVTPLISMAHRLHELSKDFILHYSARDTRESDYAGYLRSMPWSDRVFFHVSKEGTRADFNELIPEYKPGLKLYTCGSDRYMDAVFSIAEQKNWPGESLNREYFIVPEPPDYVNHAFEIELTKSGRTIHVEADMSATDALNAAGIPVDTKCSDGICGVCATPYIEGEIEHRDYVLSNKERESKMILCCSRAKNKDGLLRLDL